MHNVNRQLGVLVFVLMISVSSSCLAADEGFKLNYNFFLHGRQLKYKPMPKCPGMIDENTKEIARKTVDYSILAESVYPESKNHNAEVIIGVNSNYKKIDDKPGSFGFHASVYKDMNSDKIVVSFEGTDPKSIKDWTTNLLNGAGFEASQYTQAVLLASETKRKYEGKQVVLVGHSLGGGLTQYAAVSTGLPAYTFNAANLSKTAYMRYLITDKNKDNIVNVVNEGEFLDGVNEFTDYIGNVTDDIGNITDQLLFFMYYNYMWYEDPKVALYRSMIKRIKRVGTRGKVGKTVKISYEADSSFAAHRILLMAAFLKCVAMNYSLPDNGSINKFVDNSNIENSPDDRHAGTLLPENQYAITRQHKKHLPGTLLPNPESMPGVKPLPKTKPLPAVKPLPSIKPLPAAQKLPW